MENKRVVVTTSHFSLTSVKSSLYNENVQQRGGTEMVIVFFGIVLAFILYLTVIIPIKMVLLALKLLR